MAIYLFHVNGWKYFEFSDGSLIGRTTGDLTYPEDSNMSGKHVRLNLTESEGEIQVYVEDLGSKNGSLIDKIQISPDRPMRFQLNSLLEVGSQSFILTDSCDLKLETVNQIVELTYGKQAITIDGKQFVEKQRLEALDKIQSLEDQFKITESEINCAMIKIEELQSEISHLSEFPKEEHMRAEREKAEISKALEYQKRQAFQKVEEQMAAAIKEAEAQIVPKQSQITELESKINELKAKSEQFQREAEQRRKRFEKYAKKT